MNTRTGISIALVLLIVIGCALFALRSFTPFAASSAESAAADLSQGQTDAAPTIVQKGSVAPPPPGSEITIDPSGAHIDASVISSSAPPPAGYVEYRDGAYGFSFYHSPEAQVKVYDEGAGAETVTVENFERMRGFQVFIVPYSEPKISEERFQEDVPSGVRQNIENATLDGVQAVTFNSEDQVLGPTREIWSIHGGYLYEITTFSGVGTWFTPIIESWKFFTPGS